MAWTQPKTNWVGETDDSGNYKGDYFNAKDYNRIKNNIIELRKMALELFKNFEMPDMGADKKVGDYFYADEINRIEDNLETVCKKSIPALAGKKKSYAENTAMINFEELNRIEKCCLSLHDNLVNQAAGKRRLSFVLGGGIF